MLPETGHSVKFGFQKIIFSKYKHIKNSDFTGHPVFIFANSGNTNLTQPFPIKEKVN